VFRGFVSVVTWRKVIQLVCAWTLVNEAKSEKGQARLCGVIHLCIFFFTLLYDLVKAICRFVRYAFRGIVAAMVSVGLGLSEKTNLFLLGLLRFIVHLYLQMFW